jgi:hypothetical protein
MKQLLREPLLHFFLLGALLFAAYDRLNPEPEANPQRIVVTPGQIDHLITRFSRTWQRPPTAEEVQGLIDQFVREEIFSREAVKLGLDQNDTVIRRRLQQKMEFVSKDLFAGEAPTNAMLAEYLAKHPDAFRKDTRMTFRQVFLSGDQRGDRLEADAAQLLADLQARRAVADVSGLGDPTLLPPSMTDETQRSVESTFGRDFAAELATAATGEWIGPLRSGFGLHLVWIERREEGRVPELADVREAVRREWENARRIEARRQFYDNLLRQYQITVEWPKPQPGSQTGSG